MVYENVLSGSFIYTLGVIAGKRSPDKDVTDSVNFFQQTPNDKKVGDLLADWGGKSFIIEFKRSIAQLPDELKKSDKLLLPMKFEMNSEISDVSKKCHFIGYGEYFEALINGEKRIKTDFVFQSYLSVLSSKKDTKYSLSGFINNMTTNEDFGLTSKEEFKKYLTFLESNCLLTESSSNGGQRIKPIRGIITSVSPSGEPVLIEFRNYHELSEIMMKKSVNLSEHLEEQINMSLQKKPIIERKIGKGRNMGGQKM